MVENEKKGLVFHDRVIDLDKIPCGQDTVIKIEYINKMNIPLIIQDISTSCGCTVVDWEKEPLEPGKISQLCIQYNSNSNGLFRKTIIVNSNAPNSPVKIIIKGGG